MLVSTASPFCCIPSRAGRRESEDSSSEASAIFGANHTSSLFPFWADGGKV